MADKPVKSLVTLIGSELEELEVLAVASEDELSVELVPHWNLIAEEFPFGSTVPAIVAVVAAKVTGGCVDTVGGARFVVSEMLPIPPLVVLINIFGFAVEFVPTI